MDLRTDDDLRALYAAPTERAVRKQIAALDMHCRRFISLSPFLVLSTCDALHNLDASPRGGDPGFVKVTPGGELLIPDAPGNNRLDSLSNILATGKVGVLFLVPGIDETLRVNGRATVSTRQEDIDACANERRAPKAVIRVDVEAAYLHCAKAFMRSKLWDPSAQVDRALMPTVGQIIADQTGMATPIETREQMEARYRPDL